MKKLFIALLLILILFVAATYIFIPGKIAITVSKVVATTSEGFDTCLHNLKKWKRWWPDNLFQPGNDSVFMYNGYSYKLTDAFSDGGAIEVKLNNSPFITRIQTITNNRDAIVAEWKMVLPTGNNPFTRFARYLKAPGLKKNMQTVFDSLCSFAGRTENIYGFPIERTTFTEVTLLANKFKTAAYPTIGDIYNAINKLKRYILSRGVMEKYYPMVNVKQVDSSQYETMVAISIDKMISANGDFFISQMVPMQDRFLATEVTGGPSTLNKAHLAIEKYMQDHALSAPARPFEIWVTDRSKETDTAKWRTKLFYPSM
jgi:hypothetical protein